MKRTISIVSVIFLTLSFIGCRAANRGNVPGTTQQTTTLPGAAGTTTQQTTTPAANAAYKDGVYDGAGDKWEYGDENATVEIADGKIKSVILRRLTTEGKEVNYDEWAGQEKEGKVYPNLKQFRIDMADRMIEKQTYDVDTISGATVSCNNWKLAAQRALEKAKK